MRVLLLVLAVAACSKKEAAPPPPPPPAAPAPAPAPVPDAPVPPDAAPADASSGKLAAIDGETIGGFALGTDSTDVVGKLGQPGSKSKEETMAATGETVTTWTWKGLAITMMKNGPEYVVNAIHVKPPSTAATSRGIHLGSARSDVEGKYEKAQTDVAADDKSFLVGSPFGGELFTFKDGVVSEIFLGAMAE